MEIFELYAVYRKSVIRLICYSGDNKIILQTQKVLENGGCLSYRRLYKSVHMMPPLGPVDKVVLERNRLRRRIYKLKGQPKSCNLTDLRRQVRELLAAVEKTKSVVKILDMPWVK